MNIKSIPNKLKAILLLAALMVAPNYMRAADVFFFESFENYTLGPLDGNLLGNTNGFPDGGISNAPGTFFNPWFGDEPPNLEVVGPENGVRPHSGNKMVRGASTNNVMTVSQDLYNIGFRINRGAPFKGNLVLDWWFYDPIGGGPNAVNYQDSISLVSYPQLPTNTDYTDSFFGIGATEQFAIGAASEQSGHFDQTRYQVFVAGAANSYDGMGWFNTGVPRSVGWHQARITLSSVLPTGSAFVFFYVDDLVHPTAQNNAAGPGVNAIEMDAGFGNTTGYYDDLFLDLSQHAQLTMTKSKTNVVLRWPTGWTLQNSASAISSNFVDVVGATSPYTNSFTNTTHLYRLRFGNP